MADYLSLEPLLLGRITAELGDRFRLVAGAADLAGVLVAQQQTPGCHVLYAGTRPAPGNHRNGGQARGMQRWLVIVALRTAGDTRTGTRNRALAGELMSALDGALLNWKPGPDHGALAKDVDPPAYFEAGFGYYPLAYTCAINHTGVTT